MAGTSWQKAPPELVAAFASLVARSPELSARKMFGFVPMPGRPMKEYVVLPSDITADAVALDAWVDRAIAHVRTLPPKT